MSPGRPKKMVTSGEPFSPLTLVDVDHRIEGFIHRGSRCSATSILPLPILSFIPKRQNVLKMSDQLAAFLCRACVGF
jgi:hypothetical protein